MRIHKTIIRLIMTYTHLDTTKTEKDALKGKLFETNSETQTSDEHQICKCLNKKPKLEWNSQIDKMYEGKTAINNFPIKLLEEQIH